MRSPSWRCSTRTRCPLIPDGTDFASAAAFGVTYRTAYHALRSVAQVAEGDWVVILGAAGGVGQAALDLAVGMKARVLAAASTADKLDICRQRGAEATVAYDRGRSEGGHPRAHRRRRSRRHRSGRRTTTRSRRCVVWPAAERSSPSATPPARFRLFRSIWFCSRTSPSAAWRSAPSPPITPTTPRATCGELQQMFADGRDPALYRCPVRVGRRRGGVTTCGRAQGGRQGGHRRR